MTVTTPGDDPEPAWAAPFDRLVTRTERIDTFCSSTDWIVPLHEAFGSGPLLVEVADDAAVALAPLPGQGRRSLLCGVDILWGYARPVVGPDPDAGIDLLERVLATHRHRVAGVLVTGVATDSAFAARLTGRLGHRVVGHAEPVGRRVAHLDDGLDAFLARRARSFRRNARQAGRRAAEAGVSFEWIRGGGPELVDRAVRAERRSWKGRQGSGLVEPTFARFYRELAARVAGEGRLRAGFARHRGEDIGYILGVRRGDDYRGLQLAFAEEARALSVGNLLQLGQIERLAAEGVRRYDLGQDMPYKTAWSDELFVTETVVVAA